MLKWRLWSLGFSVSSDWNGTSFWPSNWGLRSHTEQVMGQDELMNFDDEQLFWWLVWFIDERMNCEAAKLSSFPVCIYCRHLHIICSYVVFVCISYIFFFYNNPLRNHTFVMECWFLLLLICIYFLLKGLLLVIFFKNAHMVITSVLERYIQRYIHWVVICIRHVMYLLVLDENLYECASIVKVKYNQIFIYYHINKIPVLEFNRIFFSLIYTKRFIQHKKRVLWKSSYLYVSEILISCMDNPVLGSTYFSYKLCVFFTPFLRQYTGIWFLCYSIDSKMTIIKFNVW